MDWLQSLLWDPSSVAHIVLLYAFVVAAGVYLGKIKIFGVSLGVTFVLFAGILMGHFGFTADTHILHFIREFGLILFVPGRTADDGRYPLRSSDKYSGTWCCQ